MTVEVRDPAGATRSIEAGSVVLAVGSHSRIPSLPGLQESGHWTNREGTSLRELPDGVVVLGGGPSGMELAQVYARYGVPVTLVHPRDRIHDREHPRSSHFLARGAAARRRELRLNARAVAVRAGAGERGRHVVELSDGTTAEGAALLMTVGRDIPLDRLNLGAVGIEPDNGRVKVDDRLRIAPNVFVAGDVAGPELHTHTAHYQGELAARIALGKDVKPDHSAIPRATYTDPETSSTGLLVEQAQEQGIDAQEFSRGAAALRQGAGHRDQRPRHDRGRSPAPHAWSAPSWRAGRQRDDPRGRAGGEAADAALRAGRHDPRLPHRGARAGLALHPGPQGARLT